MREIDRAEIKKATGDLFRRPSRSRISLEITPGDSESVRSAAVEALAPRARQ